MRRWNGWGEDHVDGDPGAGRPRPARADSSARASPSATRRSRTSSRPSRRRDSTPDVRLDLDPATRVRHATRPEPARLDRRALRPDPRRSRTPWRARAAAPMRATCWPSRRPAARGSSRTAAGPAWSAGSRSGRATTPVITAALDAMSRADRPRRGERARDVRRRHDRTDGRGGPRRPRPDARALPAVVGALDGRGLGRGALGRARSRSASGGSRRSSPAATSRRRRPARPADPPGVGGRPGPPPAGPRLGGTGRDPDRRGRPGDGRSRRPPDASAFVARRLAAGGRLRAGPGPFRRAARHGPRLDAARDRDDLRLGRRRARRAVPAPLPGPPRPGRRALPRRSSACPARTGSSAPRRATSARIGSRAPGRARRPASATAWERQRFRGAVPAQHALGRRVRGGHAGDRRRLGPPRAARRRARPGAPARPRATLGERVHAFSHLSHVYRSGSSLYATYVFRLAADPDETLERWRRLKTAASEVIVAHGGTISHQHGVGTRPRRRTSAPRRVRSGWPRCAARSRRSTRTG